MQSSKDIMKRHASKHCIVYIVWVELQMFSKNDMRLIYGSKVHIQKHTPLFKKGIVLHTLTSFAIGFENWTNLIYNFDNLILSNLKQTNSYCLFRLFNPRSS